MYVKYVNHLLFSFIDQLSHFLFVENKRLSEYRHVHVVLGNRAERHALPADLFEHLNIHSCMARSPNVFNVLGFFN